MRWSDRIGHRLKLRDLHIFHAVVQSGSMLKASTQLAMSQPAVSKAVADIEHTLGVRLLDRSPQGVEPTIYGQALLKRSGALFDELRHSVEDIQFLTDPNAGQLRIGVTEPMAAGFVATVIEQLTRQYPRLTLYVVQAEMTTLQNRELRSRNIELAVGRLLDPTVEEDMTTEALFPESLVVVAGRQNKWCRRRDIDLAELIDEPWIIPPFDTSVGSTNLEPFLARGKGLPRAQVQAFSIHLHYSLLTTGRFLSLVPASMMRLGAEHLPLKVLPVKLSFDSRPVGIITLKNRTLSPTAQLFIDCAREVAKALAKKKR